MTFGNYLRNQRVRQSASAFQRFYDGVQGQPFTLPAMGTLGVKAKAETPQGAAVTVNGRQLFAKALTAGGVYNLGTFERAQVVTVSPEYELVLDIGMGRWQPIGNIAEVP